METKEIKLPSGATAILKTELTAGEHDDITASLSDATNYRVSTNPEETVKNTAEINLSEMLKFKYKLISVIVTEIKLINDEKISPVNEERARNLSIKDVDLLFKESQKLYGSSMTPDEAKKE